jgi:hypothetical protein
MRIRARFVAVVAAPLVFGILAWWILLVPAKPLSAAEQAFRQAEVSIFLFHGESAFGNTPPAKQLAARFVPMMETIRSLAFTGDDKERASRAPSLTEGHMLTHVELHQGTVCFLVRIPSLVRYTDQARTHLLDIAWAAATTLTRTLRKEHDLKVGVGLRGTLLCGGVAVGMGNAVPEKWVDGLISEEPLFPFFDRPSSSVGQLETGSTVPADLLRQLGDPDAAVRSRAAVALGVVGGKPAVPALADALEDPVQVVQLNAAAALATIGADAEEAVPALVKLLRANPGPTGTNLRYQAVRTLRAIGPAARSAAPALTEASTDAEALVRHEAEAALAAVEGRASKMSPRDW